MRLSNKDTQSTVGGPFILHEAKALITVARLDGHDFIHYNEAVEQGPPKHTGRPFYFIRSRRTMAINATITTRENAAYSLCFIGTTPFPGAPCSTGSKTIVSVQAKTESSRSLPGRCSITLVLNKRSSRKIFFGDSNFKVFSPFLVSGSFSEFSLGVKIPFFAKSIY
jgi:hypothetical protein